MKMCYSIFINNIYYLDWFKMDSKPMPEADEATAGMENLNIE